MTVIMRISHGPKGDRLGESPMLIRDSLDDMISPIDGKPQTSKRAYYRQLRAAGAEINPEATVKESPNRPEYDSSSLREEIRRSIAHPQPDADINGYGD
jgi:hypothetical protein